MKYYFMKGFTLIMILIFMQILGMLGLLALQFVVNAKKMNRMLWNHVTLWEHTLETLREIEHRFYITSPSCIIPVTSSAELLLKPLSFWQSEAACHGENFKRPFMFVYESLEKEACAKVPKNHLVHYIRITLVMFENDFTAREMLQSTIIKLDNVSRACPRMHQVVSLGEETWQEVK